MSTVVNAYSDARRALAHKRGPKYKYNRRPANKKVNKAIKKINTISKMFNSELRFIDTNVGGANYMDVAGRVVTLNLSVVGDTMGTREAQEIVMTKLQIKSSVYAANVTVANVRILIVYDKQSNGATHLVNDVLTSTDPNAHRAYNGLKRFKVLYDKSIPISANQSYPKRLDKTINMRKLITHYNTTNGGTIADIVTGGLTLVALSDIVAGANAPTADFHIRLWYSP